MLIADHQLFREANRVRAGDDHAPVVIVGAGPAGLTAAYECLKLVPASAPLVLEGSGKVGGIARTEEYKGYRFDIGGHRFFTKVEAVSTLWREVLGSDFIKVPRVSRIYYRGKYYDYPLRTLATLKNIGLYETALIVGSFLKWKIKPYPNEQTFEHWVVNRFGGRLYNHFFRPYTEKVWGLSCQEIRAEWAAQRIKNLSLRKVLWNALTGAHDTTSLITEFHYPRLGPGMMWERLRDLVKARGGRVQTRSPVTRTFHDGRGRVTAVEIQSLSAAEFSPAPPVIVTGGHFISSMPLSELVLGLTPAAPPTVRKAAMALRYRDFLIVTLVIDAEDPFPDNWIYVHTAEVKVGRIQNFRAWSAEMVPEPGKASIGMEYFCHEGDELWSMSDGELLALASRELEVLGLAPASSVVDGTVIRQPKAYPVYDRNYQCHVAVIREWLDEFENLQTIGRNGMHRYNNQDHSMVTGMLAARNIALGEQNDLWAVNLERSYQEEILAEERPTPRTAVPADIASLS